MATYGNLSLSELIVYNSASDASATLTFDTNSSDGNFAMSTGLDIDGTLNLSETLTIGSSSSLSPGSTYPDFLMVGGGGFIVSGTGQYVFNAGSPLATLTYNSTTDSNFNMNYGLDINGELNVSGSLLIGTSTLGTILAYNSADNHLNLNTPLDLATSINIYDATDTSNYQIFSYNTNDSDGNFAMTTGLDINGELNVSSTTTLSGALSVYNSGTTSTSTLNSTNLSLGVSASSGGSTNNTGIVSYSLQTNANSSPSATFMFTNGGSAIICINCVVGVYSSYSGIWGCSVSTTSSSSGVGQYNNIMNNNATDAVGISYSASTNVFTIGCGNASITSNVIFTFIGSFPDTVVGMTQL